MLPGLGGWYFPITFPFGWHKSKASNNWRLAQNQSRRTRSMNIFKGLKLALALDNLCQRAGVASNINEHPAVRMSKTADDLMASIEADFITGARFLEHDLADLKEKSQPGYKAELNRQRVAQGLPPL
jgi:hypothetical protein